MLSCQRRQARSNAHFSLTVLCSIALLTTACVLPASAGQAYQPHHRLLKSIPPGLSIGRVKTETGRNVAWVTAECPGPLDLVHATPVCEGVMQRYAEADPLPQRRGSGVSLRAPIVDQGSALDGIDAAGSALPGLRYTWHQASASYTFGLLNATGFMDTTEVADDENAPLFTSSLLSNPTIQFPDDSLGGGMHWHGNANRPALFLALTSSHGLGDNPQASYGELIDVTEEGKGVFVGAELEWQGRTTYRLGAWTNTASNQRLSGNGRMANYGLYGAAYGYSDKTRWSVRGGVANARVSAAAWFLSAAIDHDLGLVTAGLGTAVTGASRDLGPDTANSWVGELYLIHDFNDAVYISPHLQYQRNPGFDASGGSCGRGQWIASLQSNVVF